MIKTMVPISTSIKRNCRKADPNPTFSRMLEA